MFRILLASLWLSLSTSLPAQTCDGFATGLEMPGADGVVWCTTVHDDGTGPALYAGGEFQGIGSLATAAIARWDGTTWTSVGGGFVTTFGAVSVVYSLFSFDGRLYAGGNFTRAGSTTIEHLAVWDGTSWSAVPGAPDGRVWALGSHQGQLLVGGQFLHAGGLLCNRIARFDPVTTIWSTMGSGFAGGIVRCFATYSEPSGPKLFVGGDQLVVSPGLFGAVLRWNGTSFDVPGGGLTGNVTFLSVQTMIVHDEGLGPELWVGGHFFQAEGNTARCIARWNGSTWSPIGLGGVDFGCQCGWSVYALAHHDDGTGEALYVAGSYPSVDGVQSPNLVRYRNGAFEGLPSTPDTRLEALTSFGGRLVASGWHRFAGTVHTERISAWHSGAWHPVAEGGSPGGAAHSLCTHDDGSGEALYGAFSTLGALAGADWMRIGRWTQGAWSALPPPPTANVWPEALLSADDGSGAGRSLFVAGAFHDAQGQNNPGVLRWNASGWSLLTSVPMDGAGASVLAAFDEGAGPRIFAGGSFATIGGVAAEDIARWDGNVWTPVGSGVGVAGDVHAMVVHDDGQGDALFVGGSFATAGGITARGIARWDGTTWSALGSGIENTPNGPGIVRALASFDDGTGAALYAAGTFNRAGGTPIANIARWSNGAWSDVGGGLHSPFAYINALAEFDDGTGNALYAAGLISTAGGTEVSGLARWNGHTWDDVHGGLGLPPFDGAGMFPPRGTALAVHDDGNGPALWVGGGFGTAGGIPSFGIARLCRHPGQLVCAGDGGGTSCPCANHSAMGSGQGCSSSLGVGGRLVANGSASLSNDTIVLTGTNMPNSSALYFQGTALAAGGAGATFGDGLRCASGTIVRIATTLNVGGTSSYPSGAMTALHVKGNVAAPSVRTYQVWYRNAAPFCTSATFNLTNGWTLSWVP